MVERAQCSVGGAEIMGLREHLQTTLGRGYVVEQELDAGGMSRVFVAKEVALDRRIVAKVLAPELAVGVNVQRFKQEATLASRLQHPHIIPVLGAGEVDGLPFYTMPFVDGRSLRHRLAEGELPIRDVISILRDVAKALESAHAVGVIHRDIKPGNVLLAGASAMVSDFGIAKALSASEGASAHLTASGLVLGTPTYMAPEQAAGDPTTDQRADIYSFGVMAYEMLAGSPPFIGRTAPEVIVAHATREATPITQVRPTAPRPLCELVMWCLEKNPAARPQHAAELLEAIDTFSAGGRGLKRPNLTRQSSRMTISVIGVLAIAVSGVAFASYRVLSRPGVDSRRVFVPPFQNLTEDPKLSMIGRIASDWVTKGVADVPGIQAVSSMAVLASVVPDSSSQLRDLPKQLKAGTVILGTILKQGDSLGFQAQIVNVGTGSIIGTIDNVRGSISDPLAAMTELRERVMAALSQPPFSRSAFVRSVAARTVPGGRIPRYEAYQLFLSGQERFYRQDYRGAISLMQSAIAIDSAFALAYVTLAISHSNLGNWYVADSVARIAENNRDDLTHADRAILDWLFANVRGDHDAAYTIAEREASRDSAFSWLYLVGYHAVATARPQSALAALNAVRDEPLKQWVLYWSVLATAYHQLSDFKSELVAVEREAALRVSQGGGSSPGRAMVARLRPLAAMGDKASVSLLVDSLVQLSTDTVNTPADVMLLTALEFRAHGDEREASVLLLRARQWLADRPAPEMQARASLRETLANVLFAMGRFDSARTHYSELVRYVPKSIAVLGRLGTVAAKLADSTGAERMAASLASNRVNHARGQDTYWRAAIAASLGHREKAVSLLRQALREGVSIGVVVHRLEEFQSLRGYPPFETLFRPRN
jgi:serine/threonine protein kinase/tetratricopeptide (TPR) repeat protein